MALAAGGGVRGPGRLPAPPTRAPRRERPPAPAATLAGCLLRLACPLIAPFGSVLKDIPGTLHEVLLFRDEAHGAAAPTMRSAMLRIRAASFPRARAG